MSLNTSMNISIELVSNPDVIKKAIMIDDIYKDMVMEDIETWYPNLNNTAYFYVYKDGMPFGLICIERFCSNGVMFHGGVWKAMRNKGTPEVLKEIIRQLKVESEGKTFLTTISTSNLPAIKMVKKAGFKEKCVINNASLKGDMMILAE